MDLLQTLALISGTVAAVAGLPQIFRLLKRKSSNDISISMYFILGMTMSIWIFYGFDRNDFAIILPNAISLCMVIATVFLVLRYRNGESTD
jgi:MtN3 and saliva related transmembrane protein